jgi:ABC-type amino acid transport substrate-binding protein
MKRYVLFVVFVCFFSSLLIGCTSRNQKQDKVLQVGTDAQFPPFEKLEGNGKITGFDADLLEAISKAEGFTTKLQHTGWEPMLQGVIQDKLDAAIAGIAINEERKKKFDFSDPYFESQQVILVRSNSTITSLSELKDKKIGVQTASTGEGVVQKAFGKTHSGIKGFDDLPSAVEDLKVGRLDAVVSDFVVMISYMRKLGTDRFKIVKDSSAPVERFGILVKKGNREVIEKINRGLKKVKQDGTYDRIYNKYFSKGKS